MRGWSVALVAGCLPPSTDTGTSGADDPATVLTSWSGTCTTGERFDASGTLVGVAVDRAVIDLWDSGVTQGWYEGHSLRIASSSAPTEDALTTDDSDDTDTGFVQVTTDVDLALTYTLTQEDVGDNAPGVGTTWLSCEENAVFDLGFVTYAVRAYDADGTLVSCSTFGHDPTSVSSGYYSTYGGAPANPDELIDCPHGDFP